MVNGWPVWWTITPLQLLAALVVVYLGGRIIIRIVRMIRQPPDTAPTVALRRGAALPGPVVIVPGRGPEDR